MSKPINKLTGRQHQTTPRKQTICITVSQELLQHQEIKTLIKNRQLSSAIETLIREKLKIPTPAIGTF